MVYWLKNLVCKGKVLGLNPMPMLVDLVVNIADVAIDCVAKVAIFNIFLKY